MSRKFRAKPPSPFKRFNSSPEVIRLAVLMYVRFPLSLRNPEDLLFERGIDVLHETIRFWWYRFGPMFAADIRRQRVSAMHGFRHWRWHLDEVYGKINGETHYLWRPVDRRREHGMLKINYSAESEIQRRWQGDAADKLVRSVE